MKIDANQMDYRTLNDVIRENAVCEIENCAGQRFIGSGMKDRKITVNGIPGNALGAYLSGGEITVNGNAQDAVGDTMNDGRIVVYGNIGDAPGYAMRGGKIFIKGNAGYRVGIHMKEYREKKPAIVIGGKCGSFMGEYQAGGILTVLGMCDDGKPIVGNFPCTGMHGGKVFLRGDISEITFPDNVNVSKATDEDLKEIMPLLSEFSKIFSVPIGDILDKDFWLLLPDTKNPYKQMYVEN